MQWARCGSRAGILAIMTAAILWGTQCRAQTEPYLMTDTVVTDCIGELTDSGGPDGAYGNNEDLIFTVEADAPLDVWFIGPVDIEGAAPGGNLFDFLVLHDGPDIGSPVLDTLFGSIASPPSYTTAGALTVHFVSDPSAQPQGFHLAWSADPPPPTPPTSSLTALGSCPFPALAWSLSYPIECDLINWSSLSVTADNGQSWPIDTVAAGAISCPGGTGNTLTLPLADDAGIDGNCTLTAALTIGVRDACDSVWNVPIAAQWTTSGCPADPTVSLDADTICTGGCAMLEATPRGCGPTVMAWTASDGSTYSGPGPWEVCPEATTTYTVTATETESGTTGSTTVTITVLDLGAWLPDTALCPGAVLALSNGPLQGEWSGPGVSGPPWAMYADSSGPGSHTVTFATTGGAGCSSSTTVEVIGFAVAPDIATCPESEPFFLNAMPGGGTWSGPGVSGNIFDPAGADTTGSSPFILTYAAEGCTGTSVVHVEPAAPAIVLESVCQSEPAFALPSEPPGGTWSGPGWDGQDGQWVPGDTPPGPVVLTYTMEGCDRTAFGVVLPIDAGPTMTSCPEQLPFVPFPSFLPPGGSWSGPGITASASTSGEYNPGLVGDGVWAPLIYAAPNGCSDTLWMYNRQTAVHPTVLHACAGEDENLLLSAGFQASPWCGQWTGIGNPGPSYVDNCDWTVSATGLQVGVHPMVYAVNGCSDTLAVVVHPAGLALDEWTGCVADEPVPLPTMPPGADWSGSGVMQDPNGMAGAWQWDPSQAGPGDHMVIWSAPAGCTDTIAAFVESPPTWPAPALSGTVCANSTLQLPPGTTNPGNGPAAGQDNWSLDGAPWPPDLTTAGLSTGAHTIGLQWSGEACSVESTWTFEVLPPLEVSLVVEDATLCTGQGTPAEAQVSGGTSGTDAVALSWSDGGLALPERILLPASSGWWAVMAEDGCSDPAIDSVYLNLAPAPTGEVTAGSSVCFGEPADLLFSSLLPQNAIHVIEGDTLGPGPHIQSLPGGASVTWVLIDPVEGCAHDTLVLVPSHPPLNAAFSVNPNADCIAWDAQPISLIDLSVGGDGGQWNWAAIDISELPDGADDTGSTPWLWGENPSLTLPAPGDWLIYLATAQDVGCADTAWQTVCILPQTNVWLPDAFSPNGDGQNDQLYPRGSGVQTWQWTILDAWGGVVHTESRGPFPPSSELGTTDAAGSPVGWDGALTGSGRQAPTGVYAIALDGVTDGGLPIRIEQWIRLIR